MKALRVLLTLVGVAAALLVLAAGLLLLPPVQASLLEWALGSATGGEVVVDSASIRAGTIHAEKIRVDRNGAILTVPELDVSLPVFAAVRHREYRIQRLVVKGWTLDLSRQRPAAVDAKSSEERAESSTSAGKEAASSTAVRGWLDEFGLRYDATVDGLELAGEVVLPPREDLPPAHARLSVQGGGLGPGRTASLQVGITFDSADVTLPVRRVQADGQVRATLDAQRRLTAVEFTGEAKNSDASGGRPLALRLGLARGGDSGGEERIEAAITREGRPRLSVTARRSPASGRFAGDWRVDAETPDLAAVPDKRVAVLASLRGDGKFETDARFAELRISGRVEAVTLADAAGENIGPLTISAEFAGTRRPAGVHVETLAATIGRPAKVATINAVQGFAFDERKGTVVPDVIGSNWLKGTLHGLPVSWLSRWLGPFSLEGGEVAGEIAVAANADALVARSTAPLTVRDVVVKRGASVLGRGLELSAPVQLSFAPQKPGEIALAPLTISAEGKRIASLDAKVVPLRERYRSVKLVAKGEADLAELARQPGAAELGWVRGRTAKIDLTTNLGQVADAYGQVEVIGGDARRSVRMQFGATIDEYRKAVFRAPLTVTVGKNTAEIALRGEWTRRDDGDHVEIETNASTVTLEQLMLVAGSIPVGREIAAAVAPANGQPQSATTVRPTGGPFWNRGFGRVRFDVRHLETGREALDGIGGTLEWEPTALRLAGGRATVHPISTKPRTGRDVNVELEPNLEITGEAEIMFNTSAPQPYRLKATGGIDEIDINRLIGPAGGGRDPVLEGRFALRDNITSDGTGLRDLIARRTDEFHLTGAHGAVRVLEAKVAQAIPEAATPMADAAAKVGSAFTWLAGVDKSARDPSKRLSRPMESVLQFSYRTKVIVFEQFAATVVRGADPTLRLRDIQVTGANERITGEGRILFGENLPIRRRPLELDLKLAFRGPPAEQLSVGAVVVPEADPQGFRQVPATLRFTGTLEQCDSTEWRDLLVKAALQPDPADKKPRK